MTTIEMKSGFVIRYVRITNLKILEEGMIEVDGVPKEEKTGLLTWSAYAFDTVMRKDVKRIIWENDELDKPST